MRDPQFRVGSHGGSAGVAVVPRQNEDGRACGTASIHNQTLCARGIAGDCPAQRECRPTQRRKSLVAGLNIQAHVDGLVVGAAVGDYCQVVGGAPQADCIPPQREARRRRGEGDRVNRGKMIVVGRRADAPVKSDIPYREILKGLLDSLPATRPWQAGTGNAGPWFRTA
jgi:hypothetical protein